jgi:hypothetical protein
MKICISFTLFGILCLLYTVESIGQSTIDTYSSGLSSIAGATVGPERSPAKWTLPGLSSDRPITTYKSGRPYLTLPVNTTSLLGSSYWMGSVTSQSFNQGKFGRFYYWDIQGNLRGSQLFLDIAGKNKRGLKLVFPRHRSLF